IVLPDGRNVRSGREAVQQSAVHCDGDGGAAARRCDRPGPETAVARGEDLGRRLFEVPGPSRYETSPQHRGGPRGRVHRRLAGGESEEVAAHPTSLTNSAARRIKWWLAGVY